MFICGASCICLSPEAQKKVKSDGRSWGLCWQLAEVCRQCRARLAGSNIRTERGANKWDLWNLGSSADELPMYRGAACGELMRPKTETRSVLRRAVSSKRNGKVSSVRCVPGDQQEGPLPSRCCSGHRWRRKGSLH